MSLDNVTSDLVPVGLLGNAENMPPTASATPVTDLASQRERAFADQSCATEKKLPGFRWRRFLQTQGILFSIGTLICLTLWALGIRFAFLPIMVSSV